MTMRRYGSAPDQGVLPEPTDEQDEGIRALGGRVWSERDAAELVAETEGTEQA